MLEPWLILVHLLLKLGVAVAVSSALVRSKEFKNLLFSEQRDTRHKIYLALAMGIPIAIGVWIRLNVKSFLSGDLSLETAILIGVIGGRLSGGVGGAVMSIPSALHGEWAAMPLNVFAGIIAGWLRRAAPEQEDIWSFSPFIDLTLYRMIRRNLPRPRVFDWQIAFFVAIVGLRFLQTEIWRFWPKSIFVLESPGLWMGSNGTLNGYLVESAIYLTVVMVVGTELKIFNSVRIQIKLEEQERLLLQARMAALQNQINPHFLFNTLNSISSLVRFDPDTAREMIIKLATILRRLLHSSESFVTLREEVEFVDNYLDIEVVRFGRDKLRVVKDLDPASLEAMVPSMLLQPLVENCIKHGLAPKVEGGSITLRGRVIKSRLVVEVEDDGVGMGAAQLLEQPDGFGAGGIGMANVAERLKVLYGDAAKMMIENRESGGTLIRLRLPILPNPEELMTSAAAPVPFGKSLRKGE
ncbi:MAG: sensor histidine kinase [Terriglobales bacterium]|jgi:two-component system, LytTR family, sensor kinase